eukprot:TRINITY_DN776336_c0_g1_i1.p1 TRINITY_DN776336_c0_g1~~TRINITY_DN776336_c0_g1_i1.p1  ORF type:complete len:167 (+),score=24.90 TRINITY_DN776336_c0_g1_i1:114-614(+)
MSSTIGEKLAPFNPTGEDVIETVLNLLKLKETDAIVDLGCGDGRFLIACAKNGVSKCVGVEYDSTFSERAKQAVEKNSVSDKVSIIHGDACCFDFSFASVVFVYLVPKGLQQLKEKFVSFLKSGGRIVTYVFSLKDLPPVEKCSVRGLNIYLYCSSSLVSDEITDQ